MSPVIKPLVMVIPSLDPGIRAWVDPMDGDNLNISLVVLAKLGKVVVVMESSSEEYM